MLTLTFTQKIHELLRSAGLAIQTLPTARREEFESATNAYLQFAHTVDVGFNRQIYGLEEAGITPPDIKKTTAAEDQNRNKALGAAGAAPTSLAEGAMGKFDIGWLNSRSGQVERDMEAELWHKARVFLEKEKENRKIGGKDERKDDQDEEMT